MSELRAQRKSAGGDVSGRHRRASWSLPLFATFVTFAFLGASVAPPQTSPAYAFAPGRSGEGQTLAVDGEYANAAGRDGYTITEPVAAVVAPTVSGAPAAGIPDPGSAQAIAYGMLQSMGLGDAEYNCLVALWNRESHWNVYAYNASSGAYGIPQALPGEKMASAGADWATSASTQVSWGLSYISGRYGTPCGAWAHSEEQGWY
ncbi:hypothetical protein BH09ACT5_BH09ACT5_22780 [soil metagenome]